MWVRSEYAGELAVLSAWLCALLPWSVSYASLDGNHLFRIHFVAGFLQFVPGLGLGRRIQTGVFVASAPGFPQDQTVALAYQWWLAGAAVFALVLAWSVLYYAFDEQAEARSQIDPVRVMGGLLLASAVPMTAATYYLAQGFTGVTLPVGVVFMYLFGGLLLVVDRT